GQPVPIGVAGELYIGGVQVARGYLHRPELTAEKFIANPFGAGRLYRTGDLARWRPDGNIEFLGRLGHQIKIRGFRVELGEIETLLNQHPLVESSVVLARKDVPGDKRLVAYVVAQPVAVDEGTLVETDSLSLAAELRPYLKQHLPDYMVPAAFMLLDSFPLTPNGKIDRKALSAPEWLGGSAYVPPQTLTQERLVAIWAEVLRADQVGIQADFFELGGHSLLATQVISRIRAAFQVELPLRRVFEYPTVAELAAQVEQALPTALPPIEPVARSERLALSFAQQRLWFLDQLGADSAYNMLAALKLTGPLNITALQQALQTIVDRHEVLRTTFATVAGQPEQIIASPVAIGLPMVEVQADAITGLVQQEMLSRFDLTQDLMLRTCLLRLSAQEHVLLVTFHHIASDGWSIGVFLRELAVLYQVFDHNQPSPLPPLPIQYADFAHWQRRWLQGHVLNRQLSYWQQQLAGAPQLSALPTDRPRPAVQTFRGGAIPVTLSPELTEQIKRLSQQNGTTLFMTLLAAFKVLLYRYSGHTDVVVGSVIANRNRQEIEGLIGFFVNTLALRTDLSGDPSFTELLDRVKAVTQAAYEHQDVPFEHLVEVLQPDRHLSHNPLVQVNFILQNAPLASVVLPGLEVNPLAITVERTRFDVEFHLWEIDDSLQGQLIYNIDLFEVTTIQRIIDHYQTLLTSIVTAPDQSIAELPLLTAGERQQRRIDSTKTWLPDDNIEFSGQIDHQVELRGHQIELNEIEGVLSQYPNVDSCVVVAREDTLDDKRLVAYVVAHPPDQGIETGQVGQWQTTFDQTYKHLAAPTDPTFNITGWQSSYTRQPIPAVEMQRWVEAAVAQIMALKPETVLEIGCGTGLLLARIAPHCSVYHGTDYAQEALAYVAGLQQSLPELAHVTLSHRTADDFTGLAADSFDTIILNSVIQYFPGIDYLLEVLAGALQVLKPGGRIYLGDVRSLPLLEAYHASVQFYQAEDDLSLAGLRQRVQQHLLDENELVIDPAFFRALPQHWPQISRVDIQPKAGQDHNELTRFRYEVILHVAETIPTASDRSAPAIEWLDWSQQQLTLTGVRQHLVERQPARLGLRGVPNGRLVAECHLLAWLATGHPTQSVAGLRQQWPVDPTAVEPDQFRRLSAELPYHMTVTWSDVEPGQGRLDVLFIRHDAPQAVEPAATHPFKPWSAYANNPLRGQLSRALIPPLRAYLQEKLPNHMVPSAFVLLDAFPLTPNGKINHRALPAPKSNLNLPTAEGSYHDFVTGEEGDQQLAYQPQQIFGEIPRLSLPLDRPRQPVQSFRGEIVAAQLGPDITRQVYALAEASRVNESTLLLAVFKVLLYRYTSQTDILVGSLAAGHPQQRTEATIINMAAIRSQLDGAATFFDYLKHLQEIVVDALDYSISPFSRLVAGLEIEPNPAISPVFQVAFAFQNFVRAADLRALEADTSQRSPFEWLDEIHRPGEFELALEILEGEERCLLNLRYNSDLFQHSTIERMLGHYIQLVTEVVVAPENKIASYHLLSIAEKQKILVDWNKTQADYPHRMRKCIHQLFEEQVERTPDAVAVVFEEQQLTYRELNNRANQLAHHLIALEVGPDVLVGLCVERSLEMIVGMLGILKAGGAYMPLDPTHPSPRLRLMLELGQVSVVLTQQKFVNRLSDNSGTTLCLDTDWPLIAAADAENPVGRGTLPNLAYVLYTSGSTGQPKGVMIEHRNLTNLVRGLKEIIYQDYGASQRVALVAPYIFDASVQQIFAALTLGHTLYIVPEEARLDGASLVRYYNRHDIDISDGTPVHLRLLLAGLPQTQTELQVKHFIIGGEALLRQDVERFIHQLAGLPPKITNVYGPAECCVDTTWYPINPDDLGQFDSIPIGKPLPNTQIYILNEANRPQPIGVPGEVCIAGAGVGRGYLGRGDLTAEKFVENPFEVGTKLYRTGDLGTYLPNGDILFVGRKDTQVKIRGYRIELG
ncbi:MAG: amino acid adenylation domain-containing protein, partial [Anaerolineae bacterium]|nr:amino acid adenylation domain-containing protein [Anaerolineae bacterium]